VYKHLRPLCYVVCWWLSVSVLLLNSRSFKVTEEHPGHGRRGIHHPGCTGRDLVVRRETAVWRGSTGGRSTSRTCHWRHQRHADGTTSHSSIHGKRQRKMGNRYNGQRKIGQWKNVKQEKRQHLRNRWKTATIFLVVHFPVAFFSCRFYLLPTAHMLDTTMYAHSHILYRVILSNGRAK